MPSSVLPGTPSRKREGATKTENKAWDPGGSTINKVNSHLHFLISAVEISEPNNAEDFDNGSDSKTDLDYLANMLVVGQNCYILSDSGNFVEVNDFSPDYETKKIPIEDAVV